MTSSNFGAEVLRPILVEIECCVSRQTRTGNLVGGVTSLGAVVLEKKDGLIVAAARTKQGFTGCLTYEWKSL